MASSLIGALRVTLGLDSAAFGKGLTEAQRKLNAAGRDFQRAGDRMKNVGRSLSIGITAPVVAFGVSAVRAAGDFESAMNRTAAVSGATTAELQQLRDVAKEMGRTTQFSASEAANALGFLAMAGFDANESMAALPGTLQLAASAQMELAEAADLVSNVLTGYGLEVSDLARVNDVLAKTFTSTNTDLQMLGASMKFVGPVASSAGVAFTETAAAIGLMGNAGIQGEMAGTALRGAISKILAPSKKAAGIMKELGLNFTDAEGRLLPLVDIIEQLEGHADDAGLFMQLFGQRAGPAMAGLVSQGADALRDLDGELQNSGGTAAKIAATQMAGFNGAMKRLKSAFEGLQIAVAESGLLDFVGNLVSGLANLMTRMAEISPAGLKLATIIAGIAAAVGPLVWVAGSLASAWGSLLPIFGGVAAAMGTTGLVATLGALATAAAPIIAIGAALALAWAAFGDKVMPVLQRLRDRFVEVLGPKLQSLFNTVSSALSELWGGPLGDAIRVVIDALGDFQAAYLGVLGEGLIRILSALVSAFEMGFKVIVDVVKLVANLLTGDFAGAWENVRGIVGSVVDGWLNILDSLAPGAAEAIRNMATGVVNLLRDVAGRMPQIGWDIIKGIVGGITGNPRAVLDALMSVVSTGVDGVKNFLGIASPSRLFMAVGGNITEGLARGVINGTGVIVAAFDGLNRMFDTQIARTTAGLERALIEPLKKGATKAQKILRALQQETLSIFDRLFPDQAMIRSLQNDISTLEGARGTPGIEDTAIDQAIAKLKEQIDDVQNGDRRKAEERRQEELEEASKRMRGSLDNLLEGLFPVEAEIQRLNEELRLLDDGLSAGMISPEDHARARKELLSALDASEIALREQRLASTQMGRMVIAAGQVGAQIGDSIFGALHDGIEGRDVFKSLKSSLSSVLKGVAHRSLQSLEMAIFGEGGLAGQLDSVFRSLFQNVFNSSSVSGGGLGSLIGSAIGSIFGKRASGGPAMANMPLIVGEKRPEVFVPSTSGRILPNVNELRGAGGGGVVELRLKDEMLEAKILSGSARVVREATPELVGLSVNETFETLGRPKI